MMVRRGRGIADLLGFAVSRSWKRTPAGGAGSRKCRDRSRVSSGYRIQGIYT